MLSDAPSRLL